MVIIIVLKNVLLTLVMVGVEAIVVVFALNYVTHHLVVTFVIMDVVIMDVLSLVIKLVGVGVVE